MFQKHDLPDSFCLLCLYLTEPQNFSRFELNPQIVKIRWWAVGLNALVVYLRSNNGEREQAVLD